MKREKKNSNSLNCHYFSGVGDGLSYLFIAFLFPIVVLFSEMLFSINRAPYLIFSVLILTFSLGRDYFFAYYDKVNSKYLFFGVLLCIHMLITAFFCGVIERVSGVAKYESIFKACYYIFCVLSLFFFLFPLPYFVKDCKILAQEYFNSSKNGINPGPLSQNYMVHGSDCLNEKI